MPYISDLVVFDAIDENLNKTVQILMQVESGAAAMILLHPNDATEFQSLFSSIKPELIGYNINNQTSLFKTIINLPKEIDKNISKSLLFQLSYLVSCLGATYIKQEQFKFLSGIKEYKQPTLLYKLNDKYFEYDLDDLKLKNNVSIDKLKKVSPLEYESLPKFLSVKDIDILDLTNLDSSFIYLSIALEPKFVIINSSGMINNLLSIKSYFN